MILVRIAYYLGGENGLKLIKYLWKFGVVMECCTSFCENFTCNTLGVGVSSYPYI